MIEAASQNAIDSHRLSAAVLTAQEGGVAVNADVIRQYTRTMQSMGAVERRYSSLSEVANVPARHVTTNHTRTGHQVAWRLAGGDGQAPAAFRTTSGRYYRFGGDG